MFELLILSFIAGAARQRADLWLQWNPNDRSLRARRLLIGSYDLDRYLVEALS